MARVLIVLFLVTLCAAPVRAAGEPLRINGSSTVYPLTESLAEAWSRARRGSPGVELGISGSKGGFRLFCRGLIDIANASRPISRAEMAACKAAGIRYLELPVAFDAITVVVNPRNTWARTMTLAELGKIWDAESDGLITRWSDVRPGWPEVPINLFMPGLNSGTSEYFLNAVVSGADKSRHDVTCSENDNLLLQGVARDANALGFFGYSYYLNNRDRLAAVAIDCGCGEAVRPTRETVLAGRYYPLSRPVFIYVRDSVLGRSEGRDFVAYYLRNAERLAEEMGYFPLPSELYRNSLHSLERPRYGTVFGGHNWTGLHIEEVMKHVPTE